MTFNSHQQLYACSHALSFESSGETALVLNQMIGEGKELCQRSFSQQDVKNVPFLPLCFHNVKVVNQSLARLSLVKRLQSHHISRI